MANKKKSLHKSKIEGAHQNRGMGHKFLKHISRTKINLFMIDIEGFQLNHKYEKRTPFETLVFLNKVKNVYCWSSKIILIIIHYEKGIRAL